MGTKFANVLKDINLHVRSGQIYGYLGRNGAGKTTSMRILMDVFKADSGSITLNGKMFNPNEQLIGYLPEERGMYSKVKVKEQLLYFAELRGANRKEAEESMQRWSEAQLKQINERYLFAEEGLDAERIYEILNIPIAVEEVVLGRQASGSGTVISFAIIFTLYMLILLYGNSVATSVAREKDSRTMELLITSTKPKTLILGKVAAMAMNMSDNTLIRISSFIPFISLFTMPIRYMMTTVPLFSLIASMLLMVGTVILFAAISIYIYRFGSLNYGNRLTLKEVVKSIRNQ